MDARILYMEDDNLTATLVLRRLQNNGFIIHHVENGAEGLQALEQSTYDLVLSDYDMPELNGLDVLRRLMADETPIPAYIFLTGQGDEDIAVEAMKLGASDYVG